MPSNFMLILYTFNSIFVTTKLFNELTRIGAIKGECKMIGKRFLIQK